MDARTIHEEVERVCALCREQPGRPIVLEELWDGDTTGWMLDLWLTTEPSGLRGLLGSNERRCVVSLNRHPCVRQLRFATLPVLVAPTPVRADIRPRGSVYGRPPERPPRPQDSLAIMAPSA